jgi:lysyl-tRNA synthetase class 2
VSQVQNDQTAARREKLQRLRTQQNAYPARTARTHTIAETQAQFGVLEVAKTVVTLAGRVRQIRTHGGAIFLDLEDGTGRLQLYASREDLGEPFATLQEFTDLGDIVEASGRVFSTQRGERTLRLTNFRLLVKTLHPLPSEWHGLKEVEQRYRHRELDLLANSDVRRVFEQRSVIVDLLRQELHAAKFMEVDTPILQPIAGGATARPFITHHNALNTDLFLRVAPELYLKRLVVGGFERVFEMARCFRNEGMDRSHNPEFTQIEGYWAYQDYTGLMDFLEGMLSRVVTRCFSDGMHPFEDKIIQWTAPFPRVRFRDAFLKATGIDLSKKPDEKKLLAVFKQMKLPVPAEPTWPHLVDELFKETVRPTMIQPTFLIDHPVELSPLAKRREDDPNFVERFQLIVAGQELVNAFSELNDPEDQAARFAEQEKLREAGDTEAQRTDQDFLRALEYGLPPTAGFGLGIERFVALLVNAHTIKEVIFFPTLRPEQSAQTRTATSLTPNVREVPLTRAKAWDIVQEFIQQPNLRKHLLAVEASMRGYAEKFHEDPEEWGIVGLLHDFDYEKHPTADLHPSAGEPILAERGVAERIRRAILAHAPHTGVVPETPMEKAIFAVDELSGFIVACALMTPSKKIEDLSLESIKKKLRSKNFAAKVSREEITQGWQLLGVSEDEHITTVLKALQAAHEELGL